MHVHYRSLVEVGAPMHNWQQGRFIDQTKYSHMPESWKKERQDIEVCLVRPHPMGNAICKAVDPETAIWIAERLRMADRLEALVEELGFKRK